MSSLPNGIPLLIAFVNRRYLRTYFLLFSTICGTYLAFGAENHLPAGSLSPELDQPDLAALLTAVQPAWAFSSSVSAALGYNDNILLSSVDPVGRGFARGGFESMLWHLPRGKTDYFVFLNGQYTRYNEPFVDSTGKVVDHNFDAFGGVEWRFKQSNWFTFAFDGQVYALDDVFDLTNISGKHAVANLNVHGLKVGPTARWAPRPWIWIEGNAMVEIQRYADGFNDGNLHDSAVRFGLKPMPRVELRADLSQRTRGFTRRHPYNFDTGEFDVGLLAITEREREGRLTVVWGRGRHWTTTTQAGAYRYTDNASRELDFHERHVRQQIDWSAGRWTLHLEGEARHKTYDHQTVGPGSNPPAQIQDEFIVRSHLEKKVSASWAVFAEYKWERSRSNDDQIASYRTNEGLLGARWSWEK